MLINILETSTIFTLFCLGGGVGYLAARFRGLSLRMINVEARLASVEKKLREQFH